MYAAKASVCIEQQNQESFWQLHDAIFDRPQELLTQAGIATFVKGDARLSSERFDKCMAGDAASKIIARDIATAERLQVNATPTFFVNGIRRDGTVDGPQLDSLLEKARNNYNPSAGAGQRSTK